MRSDIEALAESVRALATDSNALVTAVESAARDAGVLGGRAHSAGCEGVRTAPLAAELHAAAAKARAAASAIGVVVAEARQFADHLATRSGATASSGLRDQMFEVVRGVSIGLAMGGAFAATDIDIGQGMADIGSGQDPMAVLRQVNASALQNADDLMEISERLDDEAEDARPKRAADGKE